jgi:hypothetical protein
MLRIVVAISQKGRKNTSHVEQRNSNIEVLKILLNDDISLSLFFRLLVMTIVSRVSI